MARRTPSGGAIVNDLRGAYASRSVLVTGGASFIGSHLVERLLDLGADVVVVDDFSSGKRENLAALEPGRIIELDLADRVRTFSELPACEIVFHLAAVHGGRGFIDTYPDQVLVNLAIDNNLYTACLRAGTQHVVHASSACVYPTTLQAETTSRHLLSEAEAGFDEPGKAYSDGAYGWGKLMGEFQLEQFARRGPMTGASARIFTAYGERENESHAAIALIAKALLRIDPYPIWGDGLQTRNFTYVADTVHALLHLGSLRDGAPFRAVNVGSSKHHSVLEFVETTFDLFGWKPEEIDRQTWRPVGVASRASDNALSRELFNWEPNTPLREGISRTLDWYAARDDRPQTPEELEQLLLAR
jgi:nucleoside-diphosphate-sugar epimerase